MIVDEPPMARASYDHGNAAFPGVAERLLAFAAGIVTMIG
jgi:hypothetical protein